jgi:hypothetical protein
MLRAIWRKELGLRLAHASEGEVMDFASSQSTKPQETDVTMLDLFAVLYDPSGERPTPCDRQPRYAVPDAILDPDFT